MKAVIMAGGQGTRLRSVAADVPKPMVPVLGKPILQYQIENLRENGIRDIILIVGYLGDQIRDYFGDGSDFQVRIFYFTEDRPLGTAGALFYLREELNEPFLLLMGDLMLSVDFVRMMAAHKAAGGDATLFVHPNAHPYDSDVIVTDTVGKLADFTEEAMNRAHEKAETNGNAAGNGNTASRASLVTAVLGKKAPREGFYRNQVNAGIYVLSPEAIKGLSEPQEGQKIDLDRDVILPLIEKKRVYAYHSTEYVKDMGTPERYESVSQDLANGIVRSRNLSQKQRCIFLDRDGTINEACGFVKTPDELRLMEGATKAIRLINASDYLAIVVTNQPVIARGECSFEMLDTIHAKLETALGKEGAYIDDLFYCPHHKDKGFAGEIAELKFDCGCRKPKTGLITEAAARYNIDLSASWMIGDMTQDIACGNRAGLKTVLLASGEGGRDGKYDEKPDFCAENLLQAVEMILGQNN